MAFAAHAPVRKDAARNRALLLETAAELFASKGLGATLKDLAQEAGVGVGTVYRHFPTKEDLVEALFAENLAREAERARTAAQEADAWEALVRYLEGTTRAQAANRGLRTLMCQVGSKDDNVRAWKELIDPCIEQMVEAARRQGTLRHDCTASDITLLQVALVGIMDATPESPDAYRHHLQMFLDGLRAH